MRGKVLLIALLLTGCATVQPVQEPAPMPQEGDQRAGSVAHITILRHVLQLAFQLAQGAAAAWSLQEAQKEEGK